MDVISKKKVPSSLPDRVVCVLHSVEAACCSSLNVGDLIVKHLHTRQKLSFTTYVTLYSSYKYRG